MGKMMVGVNNHIGKAPFMLVPCIVRMRVAWMLNVLRRAEE